MSPASAGSRQIESPEIWGTQTSAPTNKLQKCQASTYHILWYTFWSFQFLFVPTDSRFVWKIERNFTSLRIFCGMKWKFCSLKRKNIYGTHHTREEEKKNNRNKISLLHAIRDTTNRQFNIKRNPSFYFSSFFFFSFFIFIVLLNVFSVQCFTFCLFAITNLHGDSWMWILFSFCARSACSCVCLLLFVPLFAQTSVKFYLKK